MVKRIAKNIIETTIFGGVVVGGAIGFLMLVGIVSIA
jgi:hypothetical protein